LGCAEILMLSEVIFSIMVLRIACVYKITKTFTYVESGRYRIDRPSVYPSEWANATQDEEMFGTYYISDDPDECPEETPNPRPQGCGA
jgi:hypothetical protein